MRNFEWQAGEFQKRTGIACKFARNTDSLELNKNIEIEVSGVLGKGTTVTHTVPLKRAGE